MKIKIYHMSGAGNKFSVINALENSLKIDILKKLAPVLCSKSDINPYYAEGLIYIDSGKDDLDFRAEFLNPDGSYGAMCGNGGRCAVRFAKLSSIILNHSSSVTFSMAGNVYNANINDNDTISLNFLAPLNIIFEKELILKASKLIVGYVNVGSDHAVIDFNNLNSAIEFDEFDLLEFAPEVRYHKDFEPHGVNVNVYKIENGKINLRTFERGVEAETGACGTGSLSTALIAANKYNLDFPINIIPTSKVELLIDIIGLKNNPNGLILTGPAVVLDSYEVNIPDQLIH